MKRKEMEAIITGGGSVLHAGRLITSLDKLPTAAEIASSEEDQAAAGKDLDARIADLIKQREALDAKSKDSGKGGDSKTADDYPEKFPAAIKAALQKLDKTYADVQKMSREELIALSGIAEKSADEILAFGK